MIYEALEDKTFRGDWRVEAVEEEGEREIPNYVTLFSGHEARERALEYAKWKNEPNRPITPTTPDASVDPMLSMLFESLPPIGSEWAQDARQQWLDILRRAFDRIYRDKSE